MKKEICDFCKNNDSIKCFTCIHNKHMCDNLEIIIDEEFMIADKKIDRGFSFTDIEDYTLHKWLLTHDKTCVLKMDNLPRLLTYSFTPNGIGTNIKVSCSCGDSKDITDENTW